MVRGVGGAGAKKAKTRAGKQHDHSQNEFFSLEVPSPISRTKFEGFAKSLRLFPAIYRAKGFVKLVEGNGAPGKKKGKASQGAPKLFLWNYVAGRSELEEWPKTSNGGKKTQLVFIGLKASKLKKLVSEKFMEQCK